MTARRAAREVVLTVAATALAAGAVWIVARTSGYRARVDLCLAAGVAVAVAWRLGQLVVPPPEPLDDAGAPEPPGDGLLVLTTLESRLSWGATDPDRFRERVRPLLVELATERLRSRRGIDPRTHPVPARSILGEPLWQLMTGAPERSPSRAELSRLVEAIERI